jgi:hypothetical protein
MLCGWHTLSDIPLTSVPTSLYGDEKIDIHIQFAAGTSPIAKNTGKVLFEHSAECSRIGVRGVADFEVSDGCQIRIWPAARAMQRDIEIILLGPVWATLCHQRGLLPLHASAIVTRGGITAFAGHSGAGKSTTAGLLGSSDYELIADDILPVSFNYNFIPGAWPYLRRLKLRGDSINQLGITSSEQVSETLDNEKYFVHSKYVAADKWIRLERLYLLEINQTDSRVSIDKLTDAGAVHALVDHTYHFQFILGSGRFREHLALCTQLASKIAIYRLRRPRSFEGGKELRSLIRAHVENAPDRPAPAAASATSVRTRE